MFSGYATLQEKENVNFLVNNINACFPGIVLHQFLWYTLKVLPVAQNTSLLEEVDAVGTVSTIPYCLLL